MKFLVNRFEEKFKQPDAITVRFFDENPFTVRQARYNQGGLVCYCMDGSTQGKQKVKNKWKPIECNENCEYKMKEGPGKAMCSLEGTLKFMLPEICTDKIWYMKINSYTSIQTLKNYIDFQKQLGNSLIGDYVIFLKEVEQTNIEGNKFKNKVIDIIRKEDFISNNQTISNNQINSQNQNNQPQLFTNQVKNVEENTRNSETTASKNNINKDNETKKQDKIKIEETVEKQEKLVETTEKKETTDKKTTKKTTKTKKQENKEEQKGTETPEDAELNDKFLNYHILIETKTKMLTKNGKPTEYVFATFTNTDDKTVEVIIPPKFAEELKQCDLGTSVLLDLQTKGDLTFTNSIEYMEKLLKNKAA